MVAHPPSYILNHTPSRSWGFGFYLNFIILLFLGLNALWIYRGVRHYGLVLYAVGNMALTPFTGIASLACATIGSGCPMNVTADTGLESSRAAEVASSLDKEVVLANSLIEQVVKVASGSNIVVVRNRQEDLYILSKEIQYKTTLENRESLGIHANEASEKLGYLVESLISLGVNSQSFLDFFVTEVSIYCHFLGCQLIPPSSFFSRKIFMLL